MSFTRTISDDDLRAVARSAAQMHVNSGEGLTDALIKAASASMPDSLTDEHVRRLCEMTYHETYERMFRDADGTDRLVSFDPPDAKIASARLRATKVASAASRLMAGNGEGIMTEKAASAVAGIKMPREFIPTNVFNEKTAQRATSDNIAWNDPYAEPRLLEKTLRDRLDQLKTASVSSRAGAQDALLELLDHAVYAHGDGYAAEQILSLAMEGASEAKVPEAYTMKMGSLVAEGLHQRKILTGEKTAFAGIPNLAHPIARLGAKVASYLFEQASSEEAIQDLKAARHALLSGALHAERD